MTTDFGTVIAAGTDVDVDTASVGNVVASSSVAGAFLGEAFDSHKVHGCIVSGTILADSDHTGNVDWDV